MLFLFDFLYIYSQVSKVFFHDAVVVYFITLNFFNLGT